MTQVATRRRYLARQQYMETAIQAFQALYGVKQIEDPSVRALQWFASSGGAGKEQGTAFLVRTNLIHETRDGRGGRMLLGNAGRGYYNALLDHTHWFGKTRGQPSILLAFPYLGQDGTSSTEFKECVTAFEDIGLHVHIGALPPLWNPNSTSILISSRIDGGYPE